MRGLGDPPHFEVVLVRCFVGEGSLIRSDVPTQNLGRVIRIHRVGATTVNRYSQGIKESRKNIHLNVNSRRRARERARLLENTNVGSGDHGALCTNGIAAVPVKSLQLASIS
jgi:hypothetical protein